MNWYNDVFFKLHFDMHLPAGIPDVGADFDADKMAQELADIGTEAVCFFAKSGGGYSHYPSKVHRPHPTLKRDLLKEGLQAFHARGIKVIGYYHVTNASWFAEEHPECVSRDAAGNSIGNGDQVQNCMLGTYTSDLLIPHVQEIVREYDVDGLFFDGGYVAWPCFCESCKARYLAASGEEIPTEQSGPAWRRYRRWLLKEGRRWRREVADAAHAIRPEVLVGVNWAYAARMPEIPPEGIGYLTADIMEPENSSLCASYQLRQWVNYDVPFDAMNSRMLHWWSDWTVKSTNALRQELATVLANGGRTFVGDLQHNSGMPDPEVIKRIGGAFDFVRPMVPLVKDAKAVPYVAILHSAASHYARTESLWGDDLPIRGAHLALLEGGVYAQILDEALVPQRLKDYQTLVLTEQVCLAPETLKAIVDFVREGGGLVVIGDNASRDEDGNEIEWALGEVTGLKRLGLTQFDRNYLTVADNWASELLCPEDVGRPPMLAHGYGVVSELAGAEQLGPLVAPDPGIQVASLAPDGDSGHPGITLNEYGKGKVAFVALPITRDFFDRGHYAFKYLVNGLVRAVTPKRLLEIETPSTLEATLFRQGDTLIAHLVNYHCERGIKVPAVVDQIPPVANAKVRLACDVKPQSVTIQPEGQALEYEYQDGMVEVVLPKVGIWTAVVVKQ